MGNKINIIKILKERKIILLKKMKSGSEYIYILKLFRTDPVVCPKANHGVCLARYHTYIIHDIVAMRCFLFRVLGFSV